MIGIYIYIVDYVHEGRQNSVNVYVFYFQVLVLFVPGAAITHYTSNHGLGTV